MRAAPTPTGQAFLAYIRSQAPPVRTPPPPPATPAGWDRRLAAVSESLRRVFGRTPMEACDLAPEALGTLVRRGYAIERLTFQSRPGVRVTANLYRPEPVAGRYPAVLSVHGHWPWARIDPHVQARAIGLALRGYVCLCVDAFGAGERAIEPAPGTYHGALVGASLWPSDVPLLGLQVHDNRRAVDYLITRPEVDPDRLAITGASGGGNQTLYAGATDPRLAAVVPVCGVGTLGAYLGTACCVCEVLVGGAAFATTGDLLALVAPRALLVINATRDAVQFSVGEAAKSVAYARERYRLLDAEARIRHLAIESGHDYNQPMREALYGWLDRWLCDRGDGRPAPEPALTLEDPAVLRCYPDGRSRPKTVVTIPEFALREGRARLAALGPAPDHPQRWEADANRLRARLVEVLPGAFPERVPLELTQVGEPGGTALELTTEPGLRLAGRRIAAPDGRRRGTALLLRHEGRAEPDDPVVRRLLATGRDVVTVDLRATGAGKPETPPVHGVADHHEAEWALWIGRPLLGQWTGDVLRWLDALNVLAGQGPDDEPDLEEVDHPVTLVGLGPFGVVALAAAALDPRPEAVAVVDSPISFVGEGPWRRLPMGLIAPRLLEAGDVGHLAALIAPRRLVLAGGFEPRGTPASQARIRECFAPTGTVYEVLRAGDRLVLTTAEDGLARLDP